jgi:hypothetical protein
LPVAAVAELHRSSPRELQRRLAAERRGLPFLVYRDGEGAQHIVELSSERPRLYVGRQATCDLALPWDDEVSRLHADIECVSGVWTVVDDGRCETGPCQWRASPRAAHAA